MNPRSTSKTILRTALCVAVLATASVAARSALPPSFKTAKLPSDYLRNGVPMGLDSVSAIEKQIKYQKDHKYKTGYLDAYLYWYRQRAFPNDRIDWAAYHRATRVRDGMEVAPFKKTQRAGINGAVQASEYPSVPWEFIGPRNLDVPYQIYWGTNPVSGRVNAVSFTSTPGLFYAAGAGGGLWKTVNSGGTWTPLGDYWPQIRANSIAVHPSNSNIVYVGTGDLNGFAGAYGIGLMKSTDGGATWAVKGQAEFATHAIRALAIDPETPNTLIAGTGGNPGVWGKVYRSIDAGQTWSAVLSEDAFWTDIVYGAKSGSDRNLYAVGHADGGKLFKSTDRGANWTAMTNPLGGGMRDGLDLAASPTDSNTLYLLSGSERKIYKSTDAGANWSDISAGFPNDNSNGDNYNWSQAWYDWHITCSTRADNSNDVVYVGLIDVAASPDGGSTWKAVGNTYTDSAQTHNDQHCMAVNPADPKQVLLGNDGGVYLATMNTSNDTWSIQNLNASMGISMFYRSAHHPTDPNRALGGTQDNATPVLLGDVQHWTNRVGGDGGFVAINPANPNIQYGESQFLAMARTQDQWTTQEDIAPSTGSDPVPFIAPIAIDSKSPDSVYAGTNHLYRFTNSTSTWENQVGAQQLAASGVLSYIAVAPSDSNVIYTGAENGDVWYSGNRGSTWTQVDANLPNRTVTSISVHPANPSSVLVTVSGTGSGHLFQCGDVPTANRTWTDISGAGAGRLPDLPTNTVERDPADPDLGLFVGTDNGVYYSGNGGGAWTNATAPLGLPNVQISDLHVVASTNLLYAATYGRGMWRIDIAARPKFTVSGRVTTNGVGLANVKMTAGVSTAFTDGVGRYTITNLIAGSYSVKPTKAGVSFTPTSRTVVVGPDQSGVDFTAVSATYVIEGKVTEGAAVVSGVPVKATGNIPSEVAGNTSPDLKIPDNKTTGVTHSLNLSGSGVITATSLDVNITHPNASDLEITLIHPDGTSVLVYDRSGAGANLNTTFPSPTPSAEALGVLNGKPIQGSWTLKVRDLAPFDGGRLKKWGLRIQYTQAFARYATTDSNGRYKFTNLAAGTYALQAILTGYQFNPKLAYATVGPNELNANFSAYRVPNAPSGLTAKAIGSNTVDLAWVDNSSNETGFVVERRTGIESFAAIANRGANVKTYRNGGLTSNTAYTYRVRAVNGAAASDYSNQATVKVLAAPSNLTALAVAGARINLQWTDGVSGEASFRVDRSSGGGAFSEIAIVGAGGTTHSDATVTPGVTYTYRVRARATDSVSSYSNVASRTAKP